MMRLSGLFIVLMGMFGLSGAPLAALPTAATDAVTTVQTDALAMVDAAWPFVAAIVVAFVLFRVFRRAVDSGESSTKGWSVHDFDNRKF